MADVSLRAVLAFLPQGVQILCLPHNAGWEALLAEAARSCEREWLL